PLLGELLEITPAELARGLEGRVHDRAAIGRMRLDQLARPFRIEQIGKALRRLLLLHQAGVVGDRRDQDPRRDVQAIRVVVLPREMLRDLLREIGCQPAVALPHDAVRLVGRVDDIDGMNIAAVFLADAGEDPLGTGALDAHGNAWELLLERLGQPLRKGQVHRGIEGDLSFFLCRFDQGRRDRLCRDGARRERAGRHRRRRLEQIAPREMQLAHAYTPNSLLYRALISSLIFSTPAASSLLAYHYLSAMRPPFSFT